MTRANIAIVGPTASGKSALGLELAEQMGGEIFSCDSIQVYQGLEVGSAKPSAVERARVRHHLIDVAPVGGRVSAGDFRRLLKQALGLEDLRAPFWFVGGSGFYFSAIERGMYPLLPPTPSVRAQVQAEINIHGLEVMYARLAKIDPEYARQISAQDSYRIARGLEVVMAQKKTMSQIRQEFEAQKQAHAPEIDDPYQPLVVMTRKFGLQLERETLALRIRDRTQAMLRQGLVEETRALIAQGWAEWPPLASVGYKQVKAMLAGLIAPQDLENAILTATMQLAKKQMTWFRRDREVVWLDGELKLAELAANVREHIDPK